MISNLPAMGRGTLIDDFRDSQKFIAPSVVNGYLLNRTGWCEQESDSLCVRRLRILDTFNFRFEFKDQFFDGHACPVG